MIEFVKFSLLSIGSALIVSLILAALVKPLSSFVRGLLYSPEEYRSANPHD
jgi:hypothetical protein